MDNRPIGVFDSGVGGLTVAMEIMNVMPSESICYVGDTKRAPYGDLPEKTLTVYAGEIIEALIERNVKAIVVACNTVSSQCLDELRRRFHVPIMGMIEPGVMATIQSAQGSMSALQTAPRTVCLLATKATVESGLHKRLLLERDSRLAFQAIACPAFAPLVEAGLGDSAQAYEAARRALRPLAQPPGALILGCTHYPLMEAAIRHAAGDEADLINPARFAALMLRDSLSEAGLLCASGQQACHRVFVSGAADTCGVVLDRIFGASKRPALERISLDLF